MTLASARLALLVALATASCLSIFLSQLLLALGFVLLLGIVAFRHGRFPQTSIDVPIFSLVIWTLLSASFAQNPAMAHEEAKKLVLFATFFVAVAGTTERRSLEKVAAGLLLGGLALAAFMTLQALFLGQSDLEHRPRGFLGHYMTASGLVMTILLVAAARLAFGPRPSRPRPADLVPIGVTLAAVSGLALAQHAGATGPLALRVAVVVVASAAALAAVRSSDVSGLTTNAAILLVPIAAFALLASRTRGAWLGTLAGLALLAVLRAPKLLGVFALGVVALVAFDLGGVRSRLTVTDASSRDRYYMWQAGIDMILERPVFGVGPAMVELRYGEYRWADAPGARAPHLHNNLIQIAAERGLPALALFCWWTGGILLAAWKQFAAKRQAGQGLAWPAAATLVALWALLVAGMFEYNLGDSEVIMCALIVSSFPFGPERERPEST